MQVDENVWIVSRRGLLVALAGGMAMPAMRLYAANSDFWNKKDPAEWTSEEVDKLTTKSPWAKEVTATSPRGGDNGGYGRGGGSPVGGPLPQDGGDIGGPRGGLGIPGIGMGGPRIGGMGGPGMGGGRRRRPGGEGRMPQFKGVVRWESAHPVLDALRTRLPEGFENHYVISVSGVPLDRHGDDSENSLDHLKALTSLQPKGKEIAQPGVVQQQPSSSGTSLLFGFSKEALTLTPADKQVAFETRMAGAVVKATFNPKEMMYRGKLAV